MKFIFNIFNKVGIGINSYFFKEVNTYNLAFFRIGIAFFCMAHLILIHPDLLNIFGEFGYVSRELAEVKLPDYQPRLSWITDYLNSQFLIPEEKSLYYITYAFLFFLSLLLIGFFSRVNAIICFFFFSMFFGTGNNVIYGGDCFALLSLFYCMIMPIGKSFSVDRLLFKRNKSIYTSSGTFFTRMLQLHLCVVYFFAGLSKAVGVTWWNGEGIWRALMSGYFQKVDMTWLAEYQWVAYAVSVGVVLIELTYPVLIHIKKTQLVFLACIITMHLSIAVIMGLYLFAFILIIWNITAFGWPYILQFKKRMETSRQLDTSHGPTVIAS